MKAKNIVLTDSDGETSSELHFSIRPMNAIEGIELLDKLSASFTKKEAVAISPYISDLLKLCDYRGTDGKTLVYEGLTIEQVSGMTRNPLTIIELCMEVLEYQKVFFTSSKMFRPYVEKLVAMLPTAITESTT